MENIWKKFWIGRKSNFNLQNRGFLSSKNVLQFCWKFGQMNFRWNKFAPISKILKKFFMRKIFQLQLAKSGVFSEKKGSANFLKLRSYIVYRTYIHGIFEKNLKNFFKWNKIQLQVSKSGVFREKKCYANSLKLPS